MCRRGCLNPSSLSADCCRGARSWAPWECGISVGSCVPQHSTCLNTMRATLQCVPRHNTCHATAVIQLDHNSTNQPPECPDVVTNVDRSADNRSQGRRCAAPKPSARCACVQRAAAPSHLSHPCVRTPLRTPLARTSPATSKVTSGVRGNVEALLALGASRSHPGRSCVVC